MRRLSDTLGVSRTTLYKWCGSREQLLLDVIWSVTRDVVRAIEAETASLQVPPVYRAAFACSSRRSARYRSTRPRAQRDSRRAAPHDRPGRSRLPAHGLELVRLIEDENERHDMHRGPRPPCSPRRSSGSPRAFSTTARSPPSSRESTMPCWWSISSCAARPTSIREASAADGDEDPHQARTLPDRSRWPCSRTGNGHRRRLQGDALGGHVGGRARPRRSLVHRSDAATRRESSPRGACGSAAAVEPLRYRAPEDRPGHRRAPALRGGGRGEDAAAGEVRGERGA